MIDPMALRLVLVGFLLPLAWHPLLRVLRDGIRRRIPRADPQCLKMAGVPRDLTILAVIAVAVGLLLLPDADRFAEWDFLWPALIAVAGGSAIATVLRAMRIGRIRPWAEGFSGRYDRTSQPRRFWAAVVWNALIGCAMLWLVPASIVDGPLREQEARCLDWNDSTPPADALAACNTLIAAQGVRDADTARLIAARGSAYLRLDNPTRAAADYVEAIRIDPSVSSTHYNLGLADQRLGDLGLAIDDFSAAIRADPDNIDGYLNRGITFMEIGRYDRAIVDLTTLHRARPADPIPLANRGLAYAWTGDHRRATRDFRSARALGPIDPVLLRGEALVAFRTGNRPLALARLDDALRRNPDDQWSRKLRAETYRLLGRTADHDADLRELKRREPAKRSTESGYQPVPSASRNAVSSAVETRPSAALRDG